MMGIGVFIGRCQPLHDGHRAVINYMIANCDFPYVFLGSANSSGTLKNPWTFAEREAMITTEFPSVTCVPLNDYLYDDHVWQDIVVEEFETLIATHNSPRIKLFGHTKPDNTYLAWFRNISAMLEYVEVDNHLEISATDIRNDLGGRGLLPPNVQAEFNFYKAEAERFKNYPFPDTLQFNCADALVLWHSKVLLVKRKHAPGINKWALPGGFKNNDETFTECALRELFEETGLNINAAVINGSPRMFDSHLRNFGGITRVTMCVVIRLGNDHNCIETIKAGDDAAEVSWFDINQAVNSLDMFHDHRDIISTITYYYADAASHSHKGFIHATSI